MFLDCWCGPGFSITFAILSAAYSVSTSSLKMVVVESLMLSAELPSEVTIRPHMPSS